MNPDTVATCRLTLPGPEATEALGRYLATQVRRGDTILLEGDIGAGKSLFARALIRDVLDLWGGTAEEIPSPTYTLVQTYNSFRGEIWHADLYRLALPEEVEELGLAGAFGTTLCIVEWPDRLGPDAPENALTVSLVPIGPEGSSRRVTLRSGSMRWAPVLRELASGPSGGTATPAP
jgi:tRNA threonylcarbamoyladenosine biosynthesis protein TsaE